jgi:pyruvate dehydrogenase E1 component
MLHPDQPPKRSYIEETLKGTKGPFIAASDYVRAVPEQLIRYIPGDFFVLGTDGMGRSESRENLRRHFEVDAESIVIATIYRLIAQGTMKKEELAAAIRDLGYDPNKANPLYA